MTSAPASECPCCHSLTLPGRLDWDICLVCFWEDDVLVENGRDPQSPANKSRLSTAQVNYLTLGACAEAAIPDVRAPLPGEVLPEALAAERALPGWRRVRTREDEVPFEKVAISVFDRWVGVANLHLLDCKSEREREDRNARLLSYCEALFARTPLFAAGRGDAPPVPITHLRSVQKLCAYDAEQSPSFFLLLPEFEAIYADDWDDTTVLWFRDRSRVAQLLEFVPECGLHVLEFEP